MTQNLELVSANTGEAALEPNHKTLTVDCDARVMKKMLFLSALTALISSSASLAQTSSSASFRFVAFGDMPYTIPADYPKFERLIGAINASKPEFSMFVGDTKGGSVECSDANFQKVLDYFGTFEQPLTYAVGDNEWTDCHREKAGKYNPLERLSKVRSMFFKDNMSLGKTKMPLERQADVSAHKQMVENSRWSKNGVLFTSLHIPGSNNGFERNLESITEYFARDKANVEWINASFEMATRNNAPAMVFAFQADMDFGQTNAYAISGFANTLAAFKAGAAAFKKPVLLVHGDTHLLTIDNPLMSADGKSRLENVTRLMVMGADQVQAVEVGVNPSSAGVFSFMPMIVRENLNAAK